MPIDFREPGSKRRPQSIGPGIRPKGQDGEGLQDPTHSSILHIEVK